MNTMNYAVSLVNNAIKEIEEISKNGNSYDEVKRVQSKARHLLYHKASAEGEFTWGDYRNVIAPLEDTAMNAYIAGIAADKSGYGYIRKMFVTDILRNRSVDEYYDECANEYAARELLKEDMETVYEDFLAEFGMEDEEFEADDRLMAGITEAYCEVKDLINY